MSRPIVNGIRRQCKAYATQDRFLNRIKQNRLIYDKILSGDGVFNEIVIALAGHSGVCY